MKRILATPLATKDEPVLMHIQLLEDDVVVREALYRTDADGKPTELIAQLP